jgi:hypothetical protein
MVHIANHTGMINRPVEAAVLRRHTYLIIASLKATSFKPPHFICLLELLALWVVNLMGRFFTTVEFLPTVDFSADIVQF